MVVYFEGSSIERLPAAYKALPLFMLHMYHPWHTHAGQNPVSKLNQCPSLCLVPWLYRCWWLRMARSGSTTVTSRTTEMS